MRRTIWIAVTILIMIGIMGYGLHTLNRITEVNKERREKENGKVIASQIVMTTGTDSIWDRLRETTAPPGSGVPADGTGVPMTDENGQPVTDESGQPMYETAAPAPEGGAAGTAVSEPAEGETVATEAAPAQAGQPFPDTAQTVPEQTVTTTTPMIVVPMA